MVRETRHLWVGNLPDNIREDRIREHFKRYGRVQNVKLLGRTESPGSGAATIAGANVNPQGGGVCATVAFMDIKSAAKAHNIEHVLDERTLTTEYYEPAAIPSAAGAPSAGSSPAGSGYSGSSSSVNSAQTPASTSRYHLSGEESASSTCPLTLSAAAPATWRGTNDSATEYCRRGSTSAAYTRYPRNSTPASAPYSTPPNSTDRTPHHRWYASGGGGGGESTPSTPGGCGEGGGRRRRRSGSGGASHTSRSSSSSGEPSSDSRASTPAAPHPPPTTAAAPPTTPTHNHWSSTGSGRPLAICVRNLPTRSSDSSLKDGLYHEYKKHGKVVWVKVVGQNADRYAVVRFKKPSDVEKALEVSQDKLFFGCKISVAPHQSCDEDAESAKPYETDIDEYHPKATRTLFIGNLEKDVTQTLLRDKFKPFGRIMEVDVKKGSGGGAGYAFCQYASISSVVEAIRAMDGEYVGGSRVKLGFGKPVATTCVWVDGLTEHTEKQVLGAVSRCGAATSVCVDRAAGAALVHFEQAAAASVAVRDLRRQAAAATADPDQRRLMVDYASRECQVAFYEQLQKHGGSVPVPIPGELSAHYMPPSRHDTVRHESITPRGRSASYCRGVGRGAQYPQGPEPYDTANYTPDRHYRLYDGLGSTPPADDSPYEERLQSVVVSPLRSRRHRRDSTPDEHKHTKERHRSNGARRCSGELRHRSRSGSRSEHRRRGSDADRRRHRRRRDESGSRAGTPLFDELPEGPVPAEPRRPPQPRDRSQPPMSLPLPKFAAQVLRAAGAHPPPSAPAAAPASPRPPSASSSSGGSAPHSPSLEERIRSLDEKYEKWSGSRAVAAEAAERGRFRHRLLELDINEVKPSDVVRSLLAKRSVFDEDSERLEGAVSQRPPSPSGSPRPRAVPRALQYPFPTHPPSTISAHPTDGSLESDERTPPNGISTKVLLDHQNKSDNIKILDCLDSNIDVESRTNSRLFSGLDCTSSCDPRLNRTDKLFLNDRFKKYSESDHKHESSVLVKTLSLDKLHNELGEGVSTKLDKDQIYHDKDPRRESERRRCEITLTKDIDFDTNKTQDFKERDKGINSELTKKDKFDYTKLQNLECTEVNILQNDFYNMPVKSAEFENIPTNKIDRISNCIDTINTNDNVDVPQKLDQSPKKNAQHAKFDLLERKMLQFENTHSIIDTVDFNEVKVSDNFSPISTIDSPAVDNIICHQKDKDQTVEPIVHVKPQKPLSIVQYNHKPLKPTIIRKRSIDQIENKNCNQINSETENCSPTVSLKEKEELGDVVKADKQKFDSKKINKEKNTEENISCINTVLSNEKECEKVDLERSKSVKDKSEKDKHDSNRSDKAKQSSSSNKEKMEKEKKVKDDTLERIEKGRSEREKEHLNLDHDRVCKEREEKSKHSDDNKSVRSHDHKKDKDRRRDNIAENNDTSKHSRKDDRHKHERHRKESNDIKRDSKKEHDSKSRKSSRDESTTKELCRKDSTDSSASRNSHDSTKVKECENQELKEDKSKISKHYDYKQKIDKESPPKTFEYNKFDDTTKVRTESKEEKDSVVLSVKNKMDLHGEHILKCKVDTSEKPRHYSVDSPSLETKRKERLNSCSSLPSNIGHKRRMSSQDSLDSLLDESKRIKHESKAPERRYSKDSRSNDKHKTAKFNKCNFVKLLENKTKDDKKNLVKTLEESTIDWRNHDLKDYKINDKIKFLKKSPKDSSEEKSYDNTKSDGLQNHLDFLATLELRSSEEDEKQKALRKEMKEKKRIQQLQQIQELQMQQGALQQAELMNRKDEKKHKSDEKKKDIVREKRMSTERKSRDEKLENRRKNRKQINSSDTSDSDEPKKHSIFDIVDDEPTYISMYDKVKARSCKNMQKQEEEKRQEKIKAKFSQLKQSRAKREEKKRSSWDEDSDSDQDKITKLHKVSTVSNSSDDEHVVPHNKRRDKTSLPSTQLNDNKNDDYCDIPVNNDDDARNKLSRKNSRTRIMSDSSDDETLLNTSYPNNIMKEFSYKEKPLELKTQDFLCKLVKLDIEIKDDPDKLNKNPSVALHHIKNLNDNINIKLETTEYESEYKQNCTKINDLSSENESSMCRYSDEFRKKHKKKQKRETLTISDEELKTEFTENYGTDSKYKQNLDKIRKHNNKKDKRKDKLRISTDTDDIKDDKTRLGKIKKPVHINHDGRIDYNVKKEGKMEDIFGPLSDESDTASRLFVENHKNEYSIKNYDNISQSKECISNDEAKLKEHDEIRRKKERRRKEKRHVMKEDENSLDVDAVGKAIEARLFADSISDDDNHGIETNPITNYDIKHEQDIFKYTDNITTKPVNYVNKHSDRHKKENKEKRKKKKRSRDDRLHNKHHHVHHHDKIDKLDKTMTEIPLQDSMEQIKSIVTYDIIDTSENSTSFIESQSLPRLTDSPPLSKLPIDETVDKVDMSMTETIENNKNLNIIETKIENKCDKISTDTSKDVDYGNAACSANMLEKSKPDNFIPAFDSVIDQAISEDAVRSISEFDNDAEKNAGKMITHCNKPEEKSDEKPRAIISQEETEDAVAALLGESFGGNCSTFGSCYNEVVDQTNENVENSPIESENIPEEDAEEMRQAVQNLNASEMELKPDTPMSDTLLIDTDTEEADESQQDAIDKLPVNIIATNLHLNINSDHGKSRDISNIVISKPKQITTAIQSLSNKDTKKDNVTEHKMPVVKRENIHQLTSTATPVITSWTLTNNKLRESHIRNVQSNTLPSIDTNDNKTPQVTTNIVQLKVPATHGVQVNNTQRSIIGTPSRMNTSFQVIGQINRPTQTPIMQPPTIKIPEQHLLYQKSQGIVISPRMANDVKLQSPKSSSQGDGMTSPRLTNMTILSTSPQNMNSVGMASPNTLQQRSPGQVTVVRMQQPPLSPVQTMHLPHGGRTMVSPNRPNSVLVQTQTTPIHFNRLPISPVLAPLSKQMNSNNILQQNKAIGITNANIGHQHKNISIDIRKNDQRPLSENIETSKIILSPTNLQHSTNPTVMAQNRLMSMQNAVHVGNINSSLHLTNKVLINNVNHVDKREHNQNTNISYKTELSKSEHHGQFGQTPIIQVASVNKSSGSIIQSNPKVAQETLNNRQHLPNVLHTLNSQRLLTTAPIKNIIQLDTNKNPPVFSNIRHPTVLTKLDSTNTIGVTTTTLSNVVMTPLLLKTTPMTSTIRPSINSLESREINLQNRKLVHEADRKYDDIKQISGIIYDAVDKRKELIIKSPQLSESIAKCETDFEELLKDNTNEIKVTNNPDKKLEVNVGKTVTHFSTTAQNRGDISQELLKKDVIPIAIPLLESVKYESISIDIEDKPDNPDVTEKNTNEDSKKISAVEESIEIDKAKINVDKQILNSNIVPFDNNLQEKSNKQGDIPVAEEQGFKEICNEGKDSNTTDNLNTENRNNEDNDNWSAKDINIESVIKKVDSLCNDMLTEKLDEDHHDHREVKNEGINYSDNPPVLDTPVQAVTLSETVKINTFENHNTEKINNSKRGGRSLRGRKLEKGQGRIQTRQISKPSRGGAVSKRGRGRAKVDKKIKTTINVSPNNLPGDVYDFHEDSGDESSSSPTKTETRPRLILTIKSPLTSNSNAIATSSLSITSREKVSEKSPFVNKQDKVEDFVSPSPNTRKSRRLQEKDVHRNTVDDVIEDVVKNSSIQIKVGKDINKKRPTRQTNTNAKLNQQDKSSGSDVRKSARGVKRTRDRSLSDTSLDSNEGVIKKEETPQDAKIPKLTDTSPPKSEIEISTIVKPNNAPIINSLPATTPTPIMKPPKKMISEISAKLGTAIFESTTSPPPMRTVSSPNVPEKTPEDTICKISLEPDKQTFRDYRVLRNPECVKAVPEDMLPAATAEPTEPHGHDAGFARRLIDGVPGNMMPVGAMEATDGRVQSPALPHRPPSTHRPADRATPVLMRGGEGEGSTVGGRAYRAPYAGTASLPRGAHHPPHPPPQPPPPHSPHSHLKQVAVVGPHSGAGSTARVTITSVPSVSPQGQVGVSTDSSDLARIPPPAHQQTSPITPGEAGYMHFSHQHYQMYQQHFRATQHDVRPTAAPYTRVMEAEGSEAPPLELRRPPSARVPRPAHSPSPADRHIRCRSPPPAHAGAGVSRLPPALPPPGPPGPPHGSQVPREADSLQMLLRRYPVMWQGLLALKNDCAAVQMHFVHGNPAVAGNTLPRHTDCSTPLLRIAQRMRLEPAQLDQVHRKMKMENEHCMLLALPCGRDHMDVLQQSTNLTGGFITYLQRKQAAGIVNVAPPGHHQAMYTVHIFPSCDFANENLNRIAPDLMHRVAEIAHLLIVIATV